MLNKVLLSYVKSEFCNLIKKCFLNFEVPDFVDLMFMFSPIGIISSGWCHCCWQPTNDHDKFLLQLDGTLDKVLSSHKIDDNKPNSAKAKIDTHSCNVIKSHQDGGFHGVLEYPDLSCTMHVQKFELTTTNSNVYCKIIDLAIGWDDAGKLIPEIKIYSIVWLTTSNSINKPHCMLRQLMQQLMQQAMPLAESWTHPEDQQEQPVIMVHDSDADFRQELAKIISLTKR